MATSTDLRTMLGRTGIWSAFDATPIDEVVAFGRTVEDLGFGTLWVNESSGREPFAVLGALARETRRLTLGLGIATIYARDAAAAHAGARTVADISGNQFVMGLGVSHRSSAGARGHAYAPPLAAMTAYLDAYDAAPWTGPQVADPPLVLAALGPRMLGLAARRTAGAFPYLVTSGQVAEARTTLDTAANAADAAERPVLVVSLLAALGSGPDVEAAARGAVGRYLGQPNYRASLQRAGFTDADMDAAADPLIEALVATGDPASLRSRIADMHAAGADHVAIIPLSAAGRHADVATATAVAPERG